MDIYVFLSPWMCMNSIFVLQIFSSFVKVKKGEIATEGGVRYFELKEILLLSYCQAITFYLLLKSEGQPVDGHPVIARLEEIKELMNQVFYLQTS
jgi:U3 small nucleolar RNA-associated protein 3